MLNQSIGSFDAALTQLWHSVSGPTANPHSLTVTVTTAIVIACILLLPRAIWQITGLAVTLVHELGHAYAGLLMGRGGVRIRLSPDHSGLTTSRGTRTSAPFATFWGYPAPAVAGAALLLAAVNGWAGTAVGVSLVLVLVSAVFMRGGLAWLITLGTLAVSLVLLIWVDPAYVAAAVTGLGVFFLVGAMRGFGNVLALHARGRAAAARQSDASFLARDTRVPAGVWLFLMGAVIAGCMVLTVMGILSNGV